jgi:hypothetical protein
MKRFAGFGNEDRVDELCLKIEGLYAELRLALKQKGPRQVKPTKPVAVLTAFRMLREHGIEISRSTLYRWISAGTVPAVRVGSKLWVLPAGLQKILEAWDAASIADR